MRAFAAGCVALLVAVIALHVLRSNEPLGLDQGLFACFGRFVPRGAVPYRDLWDSKPPLVFYAYALAGAFPGDVTTALFRFELVWLLGTMIAIGVLGARMFGRWEGLAAAALHALGTAAPAFGGYWARAQAEELLALPLVLAFLFAFEARERPRLAWLAGVALGIASLFKVPAILLFVGFVAWFRDRRLLHAALGAALPWALVSAAFAHAGALSALVSAAFVYARVYASTIAVPWDVVIVDGIGALIAAVPALVIAAAVGLVKRARALLVAAAASIVAVLAQRQLAGYHFLLIVPVLALAGGVGLVDLARVVVGDDRRRRLFGAASALAIVAGLAHTLHAMRAEYVARPASRDADLARLRRGFYHPGVVERVASHVAAHTRPEDRILVWGLAPAIHALADRRPATRYAFHQVLLTHAPLSRAYGDPEARRTELLASLRAAPPAYVIVGRGDASAFEPTDSLTELRAFPALDAFVASEYELETEIGSFLLFRRRGAS